MEYRVHIRLYHRSVQNDPCAMNTLIYTFVSLFTFSRAKRNSIKCVCRYFTVNVLSPMATRSGRPEHRGPPELVGLCIAGYGSARVSYVCRFHSLLGYLHSFQFYNDEEAKKYTQK